MRYFRHRSYAPKVWFVVSQVITGRIEVVLRERFRQVEGVLGSFDTRLAQKPLTLLRQISYAIRGVRFVLGAV
jgi:hypothetical protein